MLWKIVKKVLKSGFILFIVSFLILEGMIIASAKRIDDAEVDYILVPGASVYIERPSPRLIDRLEKCIEYAEVNKDARIIVSGGRGNGERITEAEAMEDYLVRFGIDRGRIIREDKSRSTYENIKFSNDIIRASDDREDIKLMVITADFHMLRTKFIAESFGFKTYGCPAGTSSRYALVKYSIREYFAFIKTILFDLL